MAIKTINGILKEDSTKTIEEFNTQIKTACDNAETVDGANDYVGLVFNLKDKRIDFIPSTKVANDYTVSNTTIVSGDEYIRTTAIPNTIGGAVAGTTFNGTVAAALDKILYPYAVPTFTSFIMNDQLFSLEVGESIVSGTKIFTWGTSASQNVLENSIKITSEGITVVENLQNTGIATFTIENDINKTTNSTHYFNIYGTTTNGGTFNRSITIYWKWKFYYGSSTSESMTSTEVKNFSGLLKTIKTHIYNTPIDNYKWVCYPSLFGTATKFTDTSTGFGIAMEAPQIVSVTNDFNVTTDYLCYRTTNSMVSNVNIQVI